MADYEELVELGFEGVDKFADKYHDKVYDHLPAVPVGKKKRLQKQQAEARKSRRDSQRYDEHIADGQQPSPDLRGHHYDRGIANPQQDDSHYQAHPDRGYSHHRAGADNWSRDDINMSAYGADPRDYRPRGDERYYEDERTYYNDSDAGTAAPRGRDAANNMRGQQMTAYQQPQYDDYGQSVRGRPDNNRRGSSWSPPRSSRGEGRTRSQSRPRARSRSQDKKHRLAATIGGALLGGITGSQVSKGKKYDTAATFIGAIVGGLGAREATEFWDKKQAQKELDGSGDYSDDDGKSRRRSKSRGRDREDRYEEDYDRNDRYEREHRGDRRY